MKILVASASYPTPDHPNFLGGAETFSVQLCESLAARGNNVRVVRSGPAWTTWDEVKINGIEVVTLPTQNLYSPWENRPRNRYLRAAWHLIEDRPLPSSGFDGVLRNFNPDVVHTNSLYGLTSAIWEKAAARQVPVVHTLHDYYLTCARSTRFKNGARCKATCGDCSFLTDGRRKATRYIDTVVSVSERTLAIHRDSGLFGSATNKAVIRNPQPSAVGDVNPVLTDDPKVTFGFIGRPSLEKGIFDLVSAFQQFDRASARLLIAGATDPAIKRQLEGLAHDVDIELLGFVPPSDFFRKIDVLVIPSIWEDPCPMVVGESFAYGRPVIGARRGGIPELIDSASGWLYEPGPGNLAELLSTVAAEKAGVAAKSRYLIDRPPVRDFEQLVSDYLAVYEDVIARRKVAALASA